MINDDRPTERELRDEFTRMTRARRVAATPRRKAVYTRAIDALLDRYNDEMKVTSCCTGQCDDSCGGYGRMLQADAARRRAEER